MAEYIPLRFRACDARFMDNIEYFRSCGWSNDMAVRLAEEEECRLLDQIERDEEDEANERLDEENTMTIANITADNVLRILGPDATDEDAQRYAGWLEANGYEIEIDGAGQLRAYREGAEIDDFEWERTLNAAFAD